MFELSKSLFGRTVPSSLGSFAMAGAPAVLVGVFAALFGPALAETHVPKADLHTCLINLAAVRSPLRFNDFAVRTWSKKTLRGPVLTTASANEFRTRLREASSGPPNFAGHYTIAVWGCGSSCTDFGIIDRLSGKVFFDEYWRQIDGSLLGSVSTFNSLRFTLNSRLLVVLGAPNEDASRAGVYFLKWTGEKLIQLRFVPGSQACTPFP